MKTKTMNFAITFMLAIAILASFNLASAMIIDNVDQGTLYPSQDTTLTITVKNTLNDDVDKVSLTLLFTEDSTKALQFSPVGSSEDSVDEIEEDEDEDLEFKIKASNNLQPGDYNIPYQLVYYNQTGSKFTKTGSIGVQVNSKLNLDFIASTSNPVFGEKGKINLKIVNQGLGEIKFLSVDLEPNGYKLLSEKKVYIGSISSDDFQTASFDVIFDKTNINLVALIQYSDFENNPRTQTITLPIKVYTQKEAISAGIKQPSKAWVIVVVIVLLILFLLYRRAKKRKKAKEKAQTLN
ncbi:hypothetical protein FJZ17_00950 [Candidatus Pacearchaeota archaeon]|nr:hypothetical protein [Candidatus Pacearchaeota archaeon]